MTEERPVRQRRVTHADVAAAAGVSRATVSYVLNKAPNQRISQATRDLVVRTARDLGHVPFAPARALRSASTNIVLVLAPNFTLGYVFDEILERINLALAQRGYAMVIHRHSQEVRSLATLWGLVSPEVVISMGRLTRDEAAVISASQVVLVYAAEFGSNALRGRAQGDYLISKGHSRLGYAFPDDPTIAEFAAERLRGFSEACAAAKLAAPVVARIGYEPTTVDRALTMWAEGGNAVTAVGAHNDDYALLVLAGLGRAGQVAGQDLAVIGVDDIPAAAIGLTTVRIDFEGIADAIVSAVFDRLAGGEPAQFVDKIEVCERTSA